MKSIVIAGNGPSLKEIDYRRLPQDFNVFRCNQFFFEDKYYLGKKVTGFFSGHTIFESLFATTTILEDKNEYFFEDKYFSGLIVDGVEYLSRQYIAEFFTVKSACDICFQNKKFARFINENYITYAKYPTTGMIMIFTAIALGYTDIYVTGIDFYSSGHNYAFDIDQAYTLKTYTSWEQIFSEDSFHSLDIEYQSIKIAMNIAGVNIYSLSDKSIVSEQLPLAPIINNTPYVPEEKSEHYIKDIILSSRQEKWRQEELRQNKGIVQNIKQKFRQKNLESEWEFLCENILIKFLYSTIKLPYVILKVLVNILK